MTQLRNPTVVTLSLLLWSLLAHGAPKHESSNRNPNQQITCPQMDSHDVAPLRYQFFTAFQMGMSGYEAPCEIKCLGKEPCQKTCQEKKGLELLSQEISRIKEKNKIQNCNAYEAICHEQCESLGSACQKACGYKPQTDITSIVAN